MKTGSGAEDGRASLRIPARRALTEDVYDAVVGLLVEHEIEPGSRVTIEGLARDLGVSPTPVREAMARLESEGFVLRRALAGGHVQGYVAAPLLDAAGFGDLYQMRLLLEPAACAAAAARVDGATVRELRRTSEQMRPAARRGGRGGVSDPHRSFAQHDSRFHQLIADASGNTLMAEAVARLRSHTHLYRLYYQQSTIEDTVAEHEAVLAALEAGDAEAAAEAMRRHIESSQHRLAGAVEE